MFWDMAYLILYLVPTQFQDSIFLLYKPIKMSALKDFLQAAAP
jgi:hypothetical protein